jgi:hypothetical protein
MSENDYPPFFKVSEHCKSSDADNPDLLNVKFLQEDTFETDYGICINANINGTDYSWTIQSFESKNRSLYKIIRELIKSGKLMSRTHKFETYCTQHPKRKAWKLRKWDLVS